MDIDNYQGQREKYGISRNGSLNHNILRVNTALVVNIRGIFANEYKFKLFSDKFIGLLKS